MTSLAPAIAISNLRYTYGKTLAVDGITLNIAPGEFFGLLGPNGAGKSTTIHMLSALLKPEQGTIHFFDTNLQHDTRASKRMMGVVPQEIALYEELSALDNLFFWGRLYGLSLAQCKRRAVQLLNLTGLRERANDLVKTFSGGMKRRVNLAAALMHQPRILLMDEPTVGVDPQSRNHIFDMLTRLHAEGMTILYTTHYMEEVERLCNRVAIIDHGKIIADGSLESLKESCRDESMILIETSIEHIEALSALDIMMNYPKETEGAVLKVSTPHPQRTLPRLIESMQSNGLPILRTEIREPNLETVFLKLTGRSLRD